MGKRNKKEIALKQRHNRVRRKISGTDQIPRLSVHRSQLNIYTQLINDLAGKTMLAASTRDKKVKALVDKGGSVKAAQLLGQVLAEQAKSKGITKVVFDRGGYTYHGRIKSLAESARKHGLEF